MWVSIVANSPAGRYFSKSKHCKDHKGCAVQMRIFVLLGFLGRFIVALKVKKTVYILSLGIKSKKHYMQWLPF